MNEDLQGLLEKINREGVEKAEAAAKQIISEAESKAAAIVAKANDEAMRAKDAAEKAAKEYAARAEVTLKQAARDTVIAVGNAVNAALERVLVKEVDQALAEPQQLSALVKEALKQLVAGEQVEVAVSPKLGEALRAALGASPVEVILDEQVRTGFTLRVEGGRVEHTFTGEALSGELKRHLRAELAALMQ